MFAILSGIHGNRPAPEAVFTEIGKLGVRRMLVLGDVIGYGPFPNDCLQGNHEAGMIGALGARSSGLVRN